MKKLFLILLTLTSPAVFAATAIANHIDIPCREFAGSFEGTIRMLPTDGSPGPLSINITAMNQLENNNVLMEVSTAPENDVNHTYRLVGTCRDGKVAVSGYPDIKLTGEIVSDEIVLKGHAFETTTEFYLVRN